MSAGLSVSSCAESVLDSVLCAHCKRSLDVRLAIIRCEACGQVYPRVGAIPVLLGEPDRALALWTAQLASAEQGAQTQFSNIEARLGSGATLPSTRARVDAMLTAARQQLSDVREVLGPLLPSPEAQLGPGVKVKSPLEQLHYLFRDWAWDDSKHAENESALGSIQEMLDDRALGKTLVLGAGACRLAYDLHLRAASSETVVLDVDPLLLAVAHQVIRGGTIAMTEATISVHELDGTARHWQLSAPFGAIPAENFHFVLADGLEPPFAYESFDTIITPWFIDRVPPDLRDFMGVVGKLLKPGGRWLNHGPLLYPKEVPLELRFGREEVLELAERAGFTIANWSTSSQPHLVSPFHGRGRVEWVLTFAATKEHVHASTARMPPAWLIFPELPVPSFAGQAQFQQAEPLVQAVILAVDGKRSLNDVTRNILGQLTQPNVDPCAVRDTIRSVLARAHPACKASD